MIQHCSLVGFDRYYSQRARNRLILVDVYDLIGRTVRTSQGEGYLQSIDAFKVLFVFSTVIFPFLVLLSPSACISLFVFVLSTLPFLPDPLLSLPSRYLHFYSVKH